MCKVTVVRTQHPNLRDPFSGQKLLNRFAEFQLFKLFGRLPRLALVVEKIGSNSNYSSWCRAKYGTIKRVKKREQIWELFIKELVPSKKTVVLEFGVAQGYSTNWWNTKLREVENQLFIIYGFDLFTGLPRSWRDAPAGEFDNGGRAPSISSDNVHFVIGDVSETFHHNFLKKFNRDEIQLIVIFDLDLYEPTTSAIGVLKSYLDSGDLLWFDEAFDADERRVLDEGSFSLNDVRAIGCTALGLGLQVN